MTRTSPFNVIELPPLDPRFVQKLDHLLHLTGAAPTSSLNVAGPGNGAAMAALSRRGYLRVEALRQATCRAADHPGDLLLVPGCGCSDDVLRIVLLLKRSVREGGLVAVSIEDLERGALEDLRARLDAAGFEVCGGDVRAVLARRRGITCGLPLAS